MPASKSSTEQQEGYGQGPEQGGETQLVKELIAALRALEPGHGEVTGFQQAIIEEHAELARALSGPRLVSPGPVIAGVNPDHGSVGDDVMISGEGLADVTKVRFGKGEARSFVSVKPTEIKVAVPQHATDEVVTVFTPLGVSASPTKFHVTDVVVKAQ